MSRTFKDATRRAASWPLWLALTTALALSLTYALFSEGEATRVFLPGETTAGHFQIELACAACHTEAFSDGESIQRSCERCHEQELALAKDSHPRDKFTDPRNAERIDRIDARYCASCHIEHRPELAAKTGLTVPEDYCYRCHQDIAQERPSHAGMPFDSCDDAGCHNFHDNRALYEDFVAKHIDDPDHRDDPVIAKVLSKAFGPEGTRATAETRHETEAGRELPDTEMDEWEASAHAKGGLSCTGCHGTAEGSWTTKVGHEVCATCHAPQTETWLSGRHGMRLLQDLPPLRVSDSRLPMKSESGHLALTCNSCHSAHGYNRERASVDSCLGCHDDPHSRAYLASPHFDLLKDERTGNAPSGSGVSCATCHMPRTELGEDSFINHNQNDNLRPNDKMVRSVCLNCHGLSFALNSLADPELIRSNFSGTSNVHVTTVELVSRRLSQNPK